LRRLPELAPGAAARCNEELWWRREDPLNRTLALPISAALRHLVLIASIMVLTMLAAESFDPRLIWDATNSSEVANG